MPSEKVRAALEELGEINIILAELIETLADEECLFCQTFPYQCHIWNNDGINLKHAQPEIFCDSSGKCKHYRKKTASVLLPPPGPNQNYVWQG